MERIRKLYSLSETKKIPSDVDDGLETLEEYNRRWHSIRILYFTVFLMSLGFSVILTGIWPYLNKLDATAGKEFMGLIVAANPFGQMIFSPIFGYLSNKLGSIRSTLLFTLGLFAIASSIYSSLEMIPTNVKYWMLMSRFLIGVSSANIAVCRSYLSAATRVIERTKAVSMVSLAQVLGFIFGPALQAAVTPLGSEGYSFFSKLLVFNMYTACGWINALMSIANLIMFLPYFFKEYKVAAREAMVTQGMLSEKETWKSIKIDYFSSWTLIIAFFVLVFNFVLLETLGTSLTMDQFAWSNDEALYYMGILMSVGAVVALVAFIFIVPLCKRIEERYVLIWGGFSLMVLGRIFCIPWGSDPPKLAEVYNITILANDEKYAGIQPDDEIFLGCPKTQEWCKTTPAITLYQFIISYTLTSIGYPIGVTLIQTIFSKKLGPRPQGVWMGLMTGSGCLSRVMGPVFVSSVYTRFGTYWIFGLTAVMMFLSMIWLQITSYRLIPPKYEESKSINLVEISPLTASKIIIKNNEEEEV